MRGLRGKRESRVSRLSWDRAEKRARHFRRQKRQWIFGAEHILEPLIGNSLPFSFLPVRTTDSTSGNVETLLNNLDNPVATKHRRDNQSHVVV